jgi:hypothetical protein
MRIPSREEVDWDGEPLLSSSPQAAAVNAATSASDVAAQRRRLACGVLTWVSFAAKDGSVRRVPGD